MKKLICLVLAVMLALSAVSAFAAEYKDKDTVKKVQQALNDAGYNCGTPDGAAGKKTKAAITSYQTDKGLTVTGVIDDELLVALGLAETETAEEAPGEVSEEAPAEAETEANAADEGYTFQGIPWGASPEEVEATLVENGLIEAETNVQLLEGETSYFPSNMNDNPSDPGSFIDYVSNAYCGVNAKDAGAKIRFGKPLKSIGGAEANGINIGYIYGIEGGAVNSDLHLSWINIDFGFAGNDVFDILTDSLSDRYGPYDEKTPYEGYVVRKWQGANNTIIALVLNTALVGLTYTKTDTYDIIQQIQTINEAGKLPLEDAGL